MSSRRPPCSLLQASILTNNNYWNEEAIHDLMSKADPLVPTETLARVYPKGPESDHVHVIAWNRKLNLSCWIVGEYTRHIFPVTINNNQNVADLQRVIQEESRLTLNIDKRNVMLWKVRSSTASTSSLLMGKGFDTRQGRQARREYSAVSRG